MEDIVVRCATGGRHFVAVLRSSLPGCTTQGYSRMAFANECDHSTVLLCPTSEGDGDSVCVRSSPTGDFPAGRPSSSRCRLSTVRTLRRLAPAITGRVLGGCSRSAIAIDRQRTATLSPMVPEVSCRCSHVGCFHQVRASEASRMMFKRRLVVLYTR